MTITTPSGQSIAYTYSNHLISSVTINGTPLLSNVSYEPFGPVRGWTWGNGATESRLHDTDGNPQQFTGVESTSYSVDSASRIVGISNSVNPSLSWNLGYDNLDRIIAAATSTSSLGWAYDADGNRTSQSGASPPVYTAGSITLTYNNRGRLATVTTSPSATTNYTYDALGQRIAKTSITAVTLFIYDETGHLLGEYDDAGNLVEETIWIGDIPVATLQPNAAGGVNIFYIHSDHLNAPKAITRPADNLIVWRWDQDPYGVAAPNQNPSGLGTFVYNLRFPGQYADTETGLNLNGARDYDPAAGRYIQSDPVGLRGGINTYAYVDGNPVSNIDPLGLCKVVLEFSKVLVSGFHISIYTSDATQTMWFSGGPTSHLNPDPRAADEGRSSTPWGFLWGSYGTADSIPSGLHTRVVVDDGKPCSCYNESFKRTIKFVNSHDIFYSPFTQNSNSLAGTELRDAGIHAPYTWPYWTPAYGNDLHNYIPILPPWYN